MKIPSWLPYCILCFSALSTLDCSNTGQVYQQFGLGEHTISTGWASYPEEGLGIIGAISQHDPEQANTILGPEESGGGLHLGLTHKLNENYGVHFGFGVGGPRGAGNTPNGGWVLGAHYFTEGGMILGLQNDHQTEEAIFTVGFDDPFWILNPFGIFGTDEE